jgi:DNA-binding beta-propeller fold protein YncE
MSFLTLLLVSNLLGQAPKAPSSLHVQKTLVVGGEGGWDYITLDAAAKRIYLPRSTRTTVLDLDGKTLGEIPNTQGVHGVALAKDLDRGFTSNGRAGTVTVFKLSTLEVVKEVKMTGDNPDAILYDPFTKRVFSFNGRGKNVTAMDASTLEVVGTIPVGGKPEFSVTDGKGHLYLNIEDTHELLRLDAKQLRVEKRWPLAPLEEPTGMAMDVAHQRLFVVGGNKLMAVVHAETGKVITTLPIGEGADAAAYDGAKGLVFSSNGEGTLTVIHQDSPDHYAVLAQVPTRKGARTMALDETTHKLYLPTATFDPAPAATAENPHPRPKMAAGSFQIVVVSE